MSSDEKPNGDSDEPALDDQQPCSTSQLTEHSSTIDAPSQLSQRRRDAIKQTYTFFVDSLLTQMVMKYHRDSSLNSAMGVVCEPDTAMPVDSPSTPDGPSTSRKQIECVCYSCHRVIAASRLAPHMEKCSGMGRTSSRVARRRLANYAGNGSSQSANSSPRVSQRASVCKNEELEIVDFEMEMDADTGDDGEWQQGPSAIPNKRRKPTQRESQSQTFAAKHRTRSQSASQNLRQR